MFMRYNNKYYFCQNIYLNSMSLAVKKIDRKVIIIKGYSRNEEEAKRTNNQIGKCRDFFGGIVGGAYNEDEILAIEEQPLTSEKLKDILSDIKVDFAIIIYIGHGAIQDNYQLFQLNEDEIINSGQIELNADKQLIIVESCRVFRENIKIVELSDNMPKYEQGGILQIRTSTEKARNLYDQQIRKCDNGMVICFACSENEKASNFIFINTLLDCANKWHVDPKKHFEVLPITTLMADVIKIVSKPEKQHPEILNDKKFPFAVSQY